MRTHRPCWMAWSKSGLWNKRSSSSWATICISADEHEAAACATLYPRKGVGAKLSTTRRRTSTGASANRGITREPWRLADDGDPARPLSARAPYIRFFLSCWPHTPRTNAPIRVPPALCPLPHLCRFTPDLPRTSMSRRGIHAGFTPKSMTPSNSPRCRCPQSGAIREEGDSHCERKVACQAGDLVFTGRRDGYLLVG